MKFLYLVIDKEQTAETLDLTTTKLLYVNITKSNRTGFYTLTMEATNRERLYIASTTSKAELQDYDSLDSCVKDVRVLFGEVTLNIILTIKD